MRFFSLEQQIFSGLVITIPDPKQKVCIFKSRLQQNNNNNNNNNNKNKKNLIILYI